MCRFLSGIRPTAVWDEQFPTAAAIWEPEGYLREDNGIGLLSVLLEVINGEDA